YFVRVDPDRGHELLDLALTSRTTTHCYQYVLLSVGRLRMTPVVEAEAIAHLADAEAEVVRSAIEVLGQFGSPAARAPLLQAFERWHEAWSGRADELRFRQAQPNPNASQAMTEDAFRQALGAAASWLADPATLASLSELCVTNGCREQ